MLFFFFIRISVHGDKLLLLEIGIANRRDGSSLFNVNERRYKEGSC